MPRLIAEVDDLVRRRKLAGLGNPDGPGWWGVYTTGEGRR